MNPKQRRGVLLMALAVLGGIGVFALVSSYVSDVRSQVEPLTTVLWLNEDVPIQQPLPENAIEEREVPRRWVPAAALRNRSELEGLVAATALPAGSILQDGMVRERPDLVDIYATFESTNEAGPPPRAEIVVGAARIIDVGAEQSEFSDDADSFGGGESRVVPVTFALSVRDSLILAYVETFAVKVRLGLLAPGDDRPLPAPDRSFELPGAAVPLEGDDDDE